MNYNRKVLKEEGLWAEKDHPIVPEQSKTPVNPEFIKKLEKIHESCNLPVN